MSNIDARHRQMVGAARTVRRIERADTTTARRRGSLFACFDQSRVTAGHFASREGGGAHHAAQAHRSLLAVVLAMGALAPQAVVGRAMHEPLGFDPRQVACFRIGGRISVRDDVGKAAVVQALLAQLRDTPAAEVGTISRTLLGPDVGMTASLVRVRGEKRMIRPHYLERDVGPSIASVLGLSVMAGRDLHTSDVASRPSVALVTASFASQAWGTGPAVGRRLSLPGHPGDIPVAGVVRAEPFEAADLGLAAK